MLMMMMKMMMMMESREPDDCHHRHLSVKLPWSLCCKMTRQLGEPFPFQQILPIHKHMLAKFGNDDDFCDNGDDDDNALYLLKILEHVLSTRDHGSH